MVIRLIGATGENEQPSAQDLLAMVTHAFEQLNVLGIVLSAFLGTIIGRQPQLKDELIRLLEGATTDNEDVVRVKQKAREFIDSIPVPVH